MSSYPESPTVSGYLDQLFHPGLSYGSVYASRYEALFVAPATGSYNFRCAADDYCMLSLSTDETEANKQVVVDFSETGLATAFFDFTK